MSSSNVLKEFLVKIGFKVDEQQFRNFSEVMRKTGSGAVELGKNTAAATTVLGASLKTIAQQMEGLYYASQRTGASAAELKEFSFAASQVGISAERAQGAIEALAAARRTNPGLNGPLAGLGIDPNQTDNAKVLMELLVKLRNMPHYQGARMASLFGIDEQTFNQLEIGLPEMQKYLALREKMFNAAGIDPGEMAARSHEFMGQLRTMEAGLGNLADIIGYRLMPYGEKAIKWIEDLVGWLTKADRSTGGLSSKILGLASAVAGGSILKGGLSALGNLFGGGGAAGAAEVAGGAAAAGEGAAAGGLALAALPAIIIAAVGAALVWMTAHPEQVRKAAEVAGNWAKKEAGKVVDAAKAEAHKLPGQVSGILHSVGQAAQSLNQQVQKSGGWVKSLAFQPGVIGDLAGAVMNLEGHAKGGYGLYRDIAGKLTAGFGHLVRPGEDFSKGLDKQGALALLSKDLQASVDSVTRLVKVHLSNNQQKALADFVFNLGEGALAKSTLLKKLNAGDFAGAADQFQYWNKVTTNGHLVANEALSRRRESEASTFRTPDKPISITQKTDIHVEGGPNAASTADEIARRQSRVNGDIVRNFHEATQ